MHSDHSTFFAARTHRALRLALTGVVMAAIFLADTTTRYEVAVPVFYTLVIFGSARVLSRRGLSALAVACIVLTVVSFVFTPHGDLQAGLINIGISIAAIAMIWVLILKTQTARAVADEAQAQLLRIARVKSLEGLTTSIAHEINQPLAAIVTSGNACQRWLAQDPPNLPKAHQALDRIVADAGRASAIIARVRSLTKGEPPHKSEFDFNQAVREIVALSEGEMERTSTSLDVDLSPDLPAAFADRVQIQQVIGNLLLNAIEALAPVAQATRNIRVTSQIEGEHIVLAVADSGVGIPAGVQEHLFEAFWTTKEEGVGVGLSISRVIVEANGGQIWAHSNAGAGTVFQFTVPAILRGRRR